LEERCPLHLSQRLAISRVAYPLGTKFMLVVATEEKANSAVRNGFDSLLMLSRRNRRTMEEHPLGFQSEVPAKSRRYFFSRARLLLELSREALKDGEPLLPEEVAQLIASAPRVAPVSFQQRQIRSYHQIDDGVPVASVAQTGENARSALHRRVLTGMLLGHAIDNGVPYRDPKQDISGAVVPMVSSTEQMPRLDDMRKAAFAGVLILPPHSPSSLWRVLERAVDTFRRVQRSASWPRIED
jgi:hypothetical protein